MNSKEDLDFQKFWLILKRRWLPATGVFSCVFGLAICATCLQKPVYEAEGKLLFKKKNETTSILGQQIGELESIAAKSNPLSTETEIIRSVPFLQKTITALGLKTEKGIPFKPEFLAGKIQIKNIPATDVLELSYQDNDPQQAAAVVNNIMSLYLENNILTNRAEAVAAGQFIAVQLPRTEATVRRAEAALRRFKEQNHVVNLEEEAKSAVASLQNLESKITETRASLEDATAQTAALQKQVARTAQEGIAMNSLNESPGVQKLLEELQQVEADLAVQQTRFADSYPAIQSLKNKRDVLKQLLKQQIVNFIGVQKTVSNSDWQMGFAKQRLTEQYARTEAERLGLSSQLASLSQAYEAYKKRINILPELEQNQRELERRLEAAQSTYGILLKKLQEVKVAENQNIGNVRIIEPATIPVKASLRQPIIILALGSASAILLATASIFLLELSDTSIKTLKEARDLFDYTLLGNIPLFGKKLSRRRKEQEWSNLEIPVRDNPRSPISEAYRMLQANLKFLSSDKALKVIVVTSSVPKEGKSTVSANLATATAQLGRRVLLVDGDMRHPLQHHLWNLTNASGLSDVIVSQAKFEECVTEVLPNLDVLTSGVIPPNPMALLDSRRMASLIEYFSEHYDFVIIDSPPLVLAADALTVGKMTDGVVVVARPGVTNSTNAAIARESLERSGQNVLGLVVNGVIPENETDSYFYYTKEYSAAEDSTNRERPRSTTGRFAN